MQFYLDTANLDELKQAKDWGILDGATTNPTLLSREGNDPKKQLKAVCEIVDGPVSAEVIDLDSKGMIKEAKELRKIADNIVIKVPLTIEGLKAVKVLEEEGIRTNVTLCFSPLQALMAAKSGASFVSPFVGRLDDISNNGMNLIAEIMQIYENYGFETQVIVASIRNPIHILEAAKIGADIATIPFKTASQMVKHPLTDIGIQRFLDDWKKLQGKIV